MQLELTPIEAPEDWHSLDVHQYAELFPAMDKNTRGELEVSILENGYRHDCPITLYQGKILDGRARHLLAVLDDFVPAFAEFHGTGEDALQFILQQNLHRRHLTVSQRAAIAVGLVDRLRQQESSHTMTVEEAVHSAAEAMDVPSRRLWALKRLQKNAPDIAARVIDGDLTLSAAEKMERSRRAEESAKSCATARKLLEASCPCPEARCKKAILALRELAGCFEVTDGVLLTVNLDRVAEVWPRIVNVIGE